MKLEIKIKRVYDPVESTDGYRVLVDRIWPRGISKEKAAINEWLKEIAPSDLLRKWFGHQESLFDEFQKKYQDELKSKTDELKHLQTISHSQNLTLVYSAKDTKCNQAIVLMQILKLLK